MHSSAHGRGSRNVPRDRRRLVTAALVIATSALVSGITTTTAASAASPSLSPRPASVFAVRPGLAVEAAQARLGLFVEANPAPPDGTAAATPVACPLISTDAMASSAASVSGAIQLDVDPWSATTAVVAELRPTSTPLGSPGGLPVVTCSTDRSADDSFTRPSVFAVSLTDGVSFGDVIRAYGLDGVLRVTPAGIGGSMVGSCLATVATALCVTMWQADGLVVGFTSEGPPSAVNTSSAGSLLTAIGPVVVDTLAVVLGAPLPCTAAQIAADTGMSLLDEPACHDGWALGASVPCPTDANAPCASREAFHVEPGHWVSDGTVTADCAENLTALGMTGATAQEFVAACDDSSPALAGGAIRPGRQGPRVRALQIALVGQGYVLPVDARYGPLTEAAVVDFQQRHSLSVDGIAGPQTQAELGI